MSRLTRLVTLCFAIFLMGGHTALAEHHLTYEVAAGDTLAGIAWRHAIDTDSLARTNGIIQPDLLEPGQTLTISFDATPVFTRIGGATALVHILQRGETPRSVALHYAIDVDDVLRENAIDNTTILTAGAPLTILQYNARAGDNQDDIFLPPAHHRLADDQSLYRLAVEQNLDLTMLRLVNGFLPATTIPGTLLLIPPVAMLQPVTGQVVAEIPTPSPTPTTTPRPTAAATRTPQPTEAPVPTSDEPTTPPQPTATLPPTPTPEPPPAQGLSVDFGDPIFYEDGRVEVIFITVHNLTISPAVEGGLHYFQLNPDGGLQWVTLLGVDHQELPIAIVDQAPLWRATVTLTDGSVWPFYAGCVYLEEVNHVGWEPTGPNTGFEWVVHWTGGFFDCGNAYHTKPADFGPGQSATVPLTVYLQHPRLWGLEGPPGRRVQSLSLGLYRSDGLWLGDVATATFP